MKEPKISIITITFNSELTIEETLKSVVSQDYSNLEYIIVDGGSTDNTLPIIEKYKDKITKIISEKDKGIADAFNKGIHYATGDMIGIINSDDVMLPGVLKQIASYYDESVDVYRGNTIIWNDKTQFKCKEFPTMKCPKIPFFVHVAHQGVFIPKRAYLKYGLFDLDFKYVMDLELLCRFYRQGAKAIRMDVDVALFRTGGITYQQLSFKKKEMKLLIIKNGGNNFQANVYYQYLLLIDMIKRYLNLFGGDLKWKLRYKKA